MHSMIALLFMPKVFLLTSWNSWTNETFIPIDISYFLYTFLIANNYKNQLSFKWNITNISLNKVFITNLLSGNDPQHWCPDQDQDQTVVSKTKESKSGCFPGWLACLRNITRAVLKAYDSS